MKSIVNENVLAVAENSTQRKSRTMDLRMEKGDVFILQRMEV